MLFHYSRDINGYWSGSTEVVDTAVVRVASLLRTKIAGKRDNFELIAAAAGGVLIQLERDNENPVGDNHP